MTQNKRMLLEELLQQLSAIANQAMEKNDLSNAVRATIAHINFLLKLKDEAPADILSVGSREMEKLCAQLEKVVGSKASPSLPVLRS